MMELVQPYKARIDTGCDWLGSIPRHWRRLPGRACYYETKTPNTGLQEDTVLSLSYGQIVVKPPEKLHGLVPASFETYQIVEPNDIVIRPTDLQNDWNSLRFGIAKVRGIITSAYMCFRTKPLLTPEYGHLLLHAYDLKKVFYGLGSGLRQNLDWRDFKYLPCLGPPLEEQVAIVRFLDHADRRIRRYIRAKRQLIALLNEQKQAIIHRIVSRGLDPKVQLKPSGVEWLGDVPEHWGVTTVRRVISFITSGSRGWAQYYSDHGDLFIQSGNLGRSLALKLDRVQHVTPPEGAEGRRTVIKKDDVLICVTGALTGNVVHVDAELPPAYVNQHVALLRACPDDINPRFLAYALHSTVGQSQFKTTEYGGTKQGLGLDDVRNVFVPLPDREEQDVLVSQLDARIEGLRSGVAALEDEVALMHEYRTRLIADVVTGKLDVRDAAVRLPDEALEADTVDDLVEDEEVIDDGELDAEPEEIEV